MIDTKTLSIKDKISLLNELYEELSGHGIGGDTELAHINPWEADLLRSVGGAGTVNEVTGLRQYLGGGGSSPPPQPTQTTTRQVPEYAPEQREYVEDIFGKSQELYEQRTAEGFQPFPGQQLAPFAAQEQEAFSGIESLARGPGAAPAFETARTAALGAAAPITAAEIQQGMNPYQQAVTDIAKREAVRQYARGPQAQLRSGAVEAGGLRGARRFIEEAEGQRNLQQQLSDIQTMGGQQAYQQAMAEAAAARGRLANLATQMPSIGTGAYQQQLAQYGQLGGVGEAQRAREQAAIDLAQSQFQREQMFPEETLATYLRFITNAPSPSGFQRDVVAPGVAGPSTLTQLAGIGTGIGTLGKAFGAFNQGGRTSGLSGIVRRARGGQIVRMQDGRSVSDRYAQAYGGNTFPTQYPLPYVSGVTIESPTEMPDYLEGQRLFEEGFTETPLAKRYVEMREAEKRRQEEALRRREEMSLDQADALRDFYKQKFAESQETREGPVAQFLTGTEETLAESIMPDDAAFEATGAVPPLTSRQELAEFAGRNDLQGKAEDVQKRIQTELSEGTSRLRNLLMGDKVESDIGYELSGFTPPQEGGATRALTAEIMDNVNITPASDLIDEGGSIATRAIDVGSDALNKVGENVSNILSPTRNSEEPAAISPEMTMGGTPATAEGTKAAGNLNKLVQGLGTEVLRQNPGVANVFGALPRSSTQSRTTLQQYAKLIGAGPDGDKKDISFDDIPKSDLINFAAAAFKAASQGSTGSGLGDLNQFFGDVGPAAGKAFKAAETKAALAKKSKQELLKGFLNFSQKERELNIKEMTARKKGAAGYESVSQADRETTALALKSALGEDVDINAPVVYEVSLFAKQNDMPLGQAIALMRQQNMLRTEPVERGFFGRAAEGIGFLPEQSEAVLGSPTATTLRSGQVGSVPYRIKN
jgi:hypothetical protein